MIGALELKRKGNVQTKTVYRNRISQVEMFDTSLIKIDQQIKKLLEFKYLKTNCHGGRHLRPYDVTQP